MKGFHPRRRSNSSANEELESAGRKTALSFETKVCLIVESRVGKKYVDGLPRDPRRVRCASRSARIWVDRRH